MEMGVMDGLFHMDAISLVLVLFTVVIFGYTCSTASSIRTLMPTCTSSVNLDGGADPLHDQHHDEQDDTSTTITTPYTPL